MVVNGSGGGKWWSMIKSYSGQWLMIINDGEQWLTTVDNNR